MRIAIAIAALALGACATVQPPPQISHEIQRHDVAVPTPCVRDADIPKKPATAMRKDGDLKQLAAGAAIDVRNLDAYSDELAAMLRACAKP